MAWWLYPFFTRVQRWSKPSFHSCILWPLNMGWNASCIELVAPAAPPPPPPPPPLQPPSLFSRDTLRIRDSKLFLFLLWDEEGIFKIHTCQLCKRFWPLHCLSTVFNIISIKRYLAQESLPALVVVCLLVVGATGHSDNCLNFCSFFGLVLCPIWTQSVKQNHRVLHTILRVMRARRNVKSIINLTRDLRALVGQRRIWTHAREYEHGTSEYKHDAPPLSASPLQQHPCWMAFDNLWASSPVQCYFEWWMLRRKPRGKCCWISCSFTLFCDNFVVLLWLHPTPLGC